MSEPEPVAAVRTIDNVEMLKALADPIRLGIINLLSRDTREGGVIMTVKEMAERLGEPQTKLYRHVKHLQAAGLIEVARTRVVSGIVEQGYRSAQLALAFAPGLFGEDTSVAADAFRAMLDGFRDKLLAQIARGTVRLKPDERPPGVAGSSLFDTAVASVPLGRAQELFDRLAALTHDIQQATGEEGEPGEARVDMDVLIACYVGDLPD